MIQRIQTVYLLVAAVLAGLFFAVPRISDADAMLQMADNFAPLGLAVLAVIAIFLFKNRKLQMKLCSVLILFAFGYLVMQLAFGFIEEAETALDASIYRAALALLIIIMTFLARRSISKDEALVRSLDRLR